MTYDDLAAELKDRATRLAGDEQFWVGLAGNPGSGKSTLAKALKERLGVRITVILMDGYHYYRSELNGMRNPVEAFARRGAPFTFNALKFVNALITARSKGEGSFPDFDHSLGDPVEDVIKLTRGPQIVLVEGNYLLLDQEPWTQLKTKVFDETWFLDVPIPECNRRLLERHIKTGLTEQQAQQRVETNDSKNAELIMARSPRNADRVIRIL